jgi:3-hydroxyisobutyrate dehydrogenase
MDSLRLEQDMGLATEVSKGLGSPMPLGEAAEKIYIEAVKGEPERARKDFSSVYEYLCSK